MDPVRFGVVLVYNLAIGLCTPAGSALFVGRGVAKLLKDPPRRLYAACMRLRRRFALYLLPMRLLYQ